MERARLRMLLMGTAGRWNDVPQGNHRHLVEHGRADRTGGS
jgi:hypothetical protein